MENQTIDPLLEKAKNFADRWAGPRIPSLAGVDLEPRLNAGGEIEVIAKTQTGTPLEGDQIPSGMESYRRVLIDWYQTFKRQQERQDV